MLRCIAAWHSCVALCEERRRAMNITAAALAVDRWNYIINGVCVTASRKCDPCDPDVGCLCLSCHASG
jgi:hypothetical protein